MLRAGHLLILCALALLTLGVVMVNSAGMAVDPVGNSGATRAQGVTLESILLGRSTVYMALAVAVMVIAAFLPVRRLAAAGMARPYLPAFLTSAAFIAGSLALVGVIALVYVPGIGKTVNGSSRWITIGRLESIQPSEFAKWGLIALVAWFGARLALVNRGPLDNAKPAITTFLGGLVPGMLGVGLVAAVITLEDLGTGVLVAAASTLVLLAAGVRFWQLAFTAGPVFLAGVGAAILHSPYRVTRLVTFLDPYADPQGAGYHMVQSMSTVAGGGLFGRGLGHGLQKFGYLPEDTTDFLFAVVCEELGLAGALFVCMLYMLMLWTLLRVARRETEPLLRLFTLGVMATIGLQACINLVVVTGLGPTKGIALPLMSSGGTGWILTAGALGLVAAIDRTSADADAWLDPKPKAAAEIEPKPKPRRARTPALAT